MTRTQTRLLLGAAALALTACSATPVVASDDLEEEVTARLTEMAGQAPDDVTCPDDLEGEVGNTTRCTLTAGADELGVTVTVTGVDGSSVDFDIAVDEM